MWKKILCALLAAFAALSLLSPSVAADDKSEIIAYIPLDDRPVNTDRVFLLAQSAGLSLVSPPEELYATRLGETVPDRRGELAAWLLDMENSGCDHYIISMDCLLSGGLVGSRRGSPGETLSIPGLGELAETELPIFILSALSSHSENRIYISDTVMRLAPTTGDMGLGSTSYEAVRAYASLDRQVPETLSLETVAETYCLPGLQSLGSQTAAWEDLTEYERSLFENEQSHVSYAALLEAGDSTILKNFISARSRKLSFTAEILKYCRGRENISLFIGVDDSTPGGGMQAAEIAFLTDIMPENTHIWSGADELGTLSLARLCTDIYACSAAVSATFLGGDGVENQWSYQSISDILSAQLRAVGAVYTEYAPDLSLLVLCSSEGIRELEAVYRENLKNGVATAIIADYNSGIENSICSLPLGSLMGFSNWPAHGNTVGLSLGAALARLAYLSTGESSADATDAFARLIAETLVCDTVYMGFVQENARESIEALGMLPSDFSGASDAVKTGLNTALLRGMRTESEKLLANFAAGSLLTGLSPRLYAHIGSAKILRTTYPWERCDEIRLEISLSTESEKSTAPYLPRALDALSAISA